MELYAPRHLLLIIVLLVIWLWPFAKIISRAGFSKWLVVVLAIPLANVIFLWWFAYARWPAAPAGIPSS